MRHLLLTVLGALAVVSCLLLSSCGGGEPPATADDAAAQVDTTAVPTTLTAGGAPVWGAVQQGRRTFYRAQLSMGHRYVVTLQPVADDEDSDLFVFTPVAAGRTLIGRSRQGHDAATVANADWLGLVPTVNGWHQIEARGVAPSTPQDPDNYRLEVDEATLCGPGCTQISTVSDHYSTWYCFRATVGTQYTITLTPSSGNPDLYVYGATSNQRRGSSTHAAGVDSVTFTAPTTGYNYLRVYGASAGGYQLQITAPSPAFTNLFFLHHSTGQGLIDGGMRAAVRAYNNAHGTSYEFWDHGYNGDGLTNANGVATGRNYGIPSDNTDPVGLHYLWKSTNGDAVAARNQILLNHQVIAFKSCFPASAIPDAATLNQYQTWYLRIRAFCDTRPDRLFVVMSTPPLHRLATNATEANNARAFANWLKSATYLSGHPNVVCFDLFDALAAPAGTTNGNRLRYEYEGSHSDSDSHPNATANSTVGPRFATFLCEQASAYAATQ